MATCHREVWIRVNAKCDEGIAPLVIALNRLEGVVTVDSCENGPWGAYVFFTYGDSWQELAGLMQAISTELSKIVLPCGYTLSLEWLGSNDKPYARISLEPEYVRVVAGGLEKVVASLNARMIGSVYGK